MLALMLLLAGQQAFFGDLNFADYETGLKYMCVAPSLQRSFPAEKLKDLPIFFVVHRRAGDAMREEPGKERNKSEGSRCIAGCFAATAAPRAVSNQS